MILMIYIGNVYIADWANSRIRKVTTSTSIISKIAGTSSAGYSGDNGLATSTALNYPSGIALDTSGTLPFMLSLQVQLYSHTQYRQRVRR